MGTHGCRAMIDRMAAPSTRRSASRKAGSGFSPSSCGASRRERRRRGGGEEGVRKAGGHAGARREVRIRQVRQTLLQHCNRRVMAHGRTHSPTFPTHPHSLPQLRTSVRTSHAVGAVAGGIEGGALRRCERAVAGGGGRLCALVVRTVVGVGEGGGGGGGDGADSVTGATAATGEGGPAPALASCGSNGASAETASAQQGRSLMRAGRKGEQEERRERGGGERERGGSSVRKRRLAEHHAQSDIIKRQKARYARVLSSKPKQLGARGVSRGSPPKESLLDNRGVSQSAPPGGRPFWRCAVGRNRRGGSQRKSTLSRSSARSGDIVSGRSGGSGGAAVWAERQGRQQSRA